MFCSTVPFVTNQNQLLVSAACIAIGQLGRCTALPIPDGKVARSGSPDAKRPAGSGLSKAQVMEQLMVAMTNAKLSSKVRERAAKSLGLLCVGEQFPHTREVIQGFLDVAKEVIFVFWVIQ